MKRILLLGIFVFSAVMIHAQVDSFMVDKKVFKFITPENWVIDQQADKETNALNWNVVLRFVVEGKDIGAKIFAGIIDNSVLYVEQTEKEKKDAEKKIIVDTVLTVSQRMGINVRISDKPSKYKLPLKIENIFIYKLSETESLVIGYYAFGQPNITDSLMKGYEQFRADFLKRNGKSIDALRPMVFHYENTINDSFLCGKKHFRFSYQPNWKITEKCITSSSSPSVGNMQLKQDSIEDIVRISIVAKDITPPPVKIATQPYERNGGFEKKSITPLPQKNVTPISTGNQKDTLQDFIFSYTNLTSQDFSYFIPGFNDGLQQNSGATKIDYFITVTDKTGSVYSLEFELSFHPKTIDQEVYYHEMLRGYILQFIQENGLHRKI